jgi:cell wall assembly regulator SMI1
MALKMSRSRKALLVGCTLMAIIVAVVMLAGPSIQRSFFYPKPRGLPSVVGQRTEQLLVRLQAVLETNAPTIAQSLQPGLSDAQIVELEAQGDFRLSEDLRALYRWHNGMPTNSTVGLLPGLRFVPLAQVVAERALMQQQSGAAFRIFAGHRKAWLHILDDGAGDGYFYDPERTDAQGAFFFHFAEAGHYVWFPSLRNFLSGVIDCYQTRAVKVAVDGKSLDEDADRTEKIWSRLGKSREG